MTKIIKQQAQAQAQAQAQKTPKNTEQTDFTPIRSQPPLPNQQDDKKDR